MTKIAEAWGEQGQTKRPQRDQAAANMRYLWLKHVNCWAVILCCIGKSSNADPSQSPELPKLPQLPKIPALAMGDKSVEVKLQIEADLFCDSTGRLCPPTSFITPASPPGPAAAGIRLNSLGRVGDC
jgi:hypothetical protein